MYFINRLCDRVIWLKHGKLHMEGSAHDVTQAYETYQLKRDGEGTVESAPSDSQKGTDSFRVVIRKMLLTPYPTVRCGDDLNIEIEIETGDSSIPYRVAAILKRIDGINITGTGTKNHDTFRGNSNLRLCFPSIQLKEGTFFVDIFAMDEKFVHIYDRKASDPFTIPKESVEPGLLNLPHRWIP
jgi:hypothetical protein